MLDKLPNKSKRVLPDEDMDDMFHALGRPSDMHRETYRNYYCTEGRESDRFKTSPHWDFSHTINGGRSHIFKVNDSGLDAIASYIEGLDGVAL